MFSLIQMEVVLVHTHYTHIYTHAYINIYILLVIMHTYVSLLWRLRVPRGNMPAATSTPNTQILVSNDIFE